MSDESTRASSNTTRASLLDAGSLSISGCAIRLCVTILGTDQQKVSATREYLRAREQEINNDARIALNDAFGKKGADYALGPIEFAGERMTVTVYGHGKEIRSRGVYGGERWVERVDRFQFFLRRYLEFTLKHSQNLEAKLIDVRWEPGDGLLCSDHLVDPSSRDPALSAEIRRLRDVENRYDRNRTLFLSCIPLTLLIIVPSFWLVYHYSPSANRGLHMFILAVCWIYLIAPLIILGISTWANSGSTRQEIYRKEANLDLRGVLDGPEQNAYKLFQINSSELKRYYDQALRQRALVFSLGIFCILGGFIVIGATMYVLVYSLPHASLAEKLVVGGLGVVGGILANFIAVIFLQMFRSIVTSMVNFHNRLVLTNHIYFGNLLLARVTDPALREQTLSKLALTLSHLYGPMTADGIEVTDSDRERNPSSGKHDGFIGKLFG